jgi:hypothetical protein
LDRVNLDLGLFDCLERQHVFFVVPELYQCPFSTFEYDYSSAGCAIFSARGMQVHLCEFDYLVPIIDRNDLISGGLGSRPDDLGPPALIYFRHSFQFLATVEADLGGRCDGHPIKEIVGLDPQVGAAIQVLFSVPLELGGMQEAVIGLHTIGDHGTDLERPIHSAEAGSTRPVRSQVIVQLGEVDRRRVHPEVDDPPD